MLYFEHKHLYRRIKAEVPEERYTIAVRQGAHPPRGRGHQRRSPGARWCYTADEAAEELGRRASRSRWSTCARSCPGTRRPCSTSVREDVEGARPPRGHAHRRLRRRDRRDDRRGGVRVRSTRRSSGSPRPTRPSRSRRRSRRPSFRRSRRRRRAAGAGGVLMADGTTPSTSSCRRWASPSRRGRSSSG